MRIRYEVHFRAYDEDCDGTHYDIYEKKVFDSMKEAQAFLETKSAQDDAFIVERTETMKLKDAINGADCIFTSIWMEAGKSGYEVKLTKTDAMKACVDFLEHEFDEIDQAIYNKEGRAVVYLNVDERCADSSFTLEIGSC